MFSLRIHVDFIAAVSCSCILFSDYSDCRSDDQTRWKTQSNSVWNECTNTSTTLTRLHGTGSPVFPGVVPENCRCDSAGDGSGHRDGHHDCSWAACPAATFVRRCGHSVSTAAACCCWVDGRRQRRQHGGGSTTLRRVCNENGPLRQSLRRQKTWLGLKYLMGVTRIDHSEQCATRLSMWF